jgi:hypothetical protein
VTRLDREEARRAAASVDLGPVARGVAVVAAVALLAYAASLFAPSGGAFGGPLQGAVAGSASFTTIPRTRGGGVTLVVPVPWNAGTGNVVLDELAPIQADGVDVKRAGVAPPGSVALESQRGFPPDGVTLLPVDGYTVAPGVGDLDGFQIAIGLTGQGTVAGFTLHYRVGGTSYVTILPDGAMLCPAGCEGRSEAEDAQRAALSELDPFVEAPDR